MQVQIISDNERIINKIKDYLVKNKNSYFLSNVEEAKFTLLYEDQVDEIIYNSTFSQAQEFVKYARNQGIKLPILAIIKDGTSADFCKLLDCGVDDCVSEECKCEEMCCRINALSRRSGYYKDSKVTFKDLSLDCRVFTLSCGEKMANLNRKEFQIMELLMNNPQMLFSPQKIMDKIWGENDSDFSVVWTYIGFLRRKLRMLKSATTIKVTRNLGYHLV